MLSIGKRLCIWAGVVAAILAIPLVAMQFTSEVDWGLFDFVFMGGLLFGAAVAFEFVASQMNNTAYRFGVGIAALTVTLLVWVNAAVGIIGDDNPGNLMYFGVLMVGLIGTVISHFKADRLANTLFAAAIAQGIVAVLALIFFYSAAPGPVGVLTINMFFLVMFVVSGLLFRHAHETSLLPRTNY